MKSQPTASRLPQTALAYIKDQLSTSSTSFAKEWQQLDAASKDTLKRWAREEMAVLGLSIAGVEAA